MKYKYIVWVNGVPKYHTNYKSAERAYAEYSLDYDKIQIEKILSPLKKTKSNLNIE